ncbi:DUF1932 domain-containing protein [Sphingomonas oryzagri]|uniref:DUF1932 domain-containing protein n=1 Tax=Sphingomonas oryzagri TaxID=3042314 RepID=A0ABT6N263_9SPHN|nr:DUF1932 domain-containing protein [Sphingomonas oryzagri]MDH7639267.1 DUF1932 domain-containing protein [Sphingomonas oryzagri]
MNIGSIAVIGFGEAAQAFVVGMPGKLISYDRKIETVHERADKLADGQRLGVTMAGSNGEAVAEAGVILSLVTADQAEQAARATAASLRPGAFYFDMNSVAPDTKRLSAEVVENQGGLYVDVAVMAPVHPGRRAVPLLVSGPHAQEGARQLREVGFDMVRVIGDTVGAASAVKMIRSIMVKGIEALSAECAMAAKLSGVLDEVISSLDTSWPSADWVARFDYNLDRMLVHGLRRSEEMDEVVKTIEGLGMRAPMSRGTAERQREIGGFRLAPPQGLDSKLEQLGTLLSHRDNG